MVENQSSKEQVAQETLNTINQNIQKYQDRYNKYSNLYSKTSDPTQAEQYDKQRIEAQFFIESLKESKSYATGEYSKSSVMNYAFALAQARNDRNARIIALQRLEKRRQFQPTTPQDKGGGYFVDPKTGRGFSSRQDLTKQGYKRTATIQEVRQGKLFRLGNVYYGSETQKPVLEKAKKDYEDYQRKIKSGEIQVFGGTGLTARQEAKKELLERGGFITRTEKPKEYFISTRPRPLTFKEVVERPTYLQAEPLPPTERAIKERTFIGKVQTRILDPLEAFYSEKLTIPLLKPFEKEFESRQKKISSLKEEEYIKLIEIPEKYSEKVKGGLGAVYKDIKYRPVENILIYGAGFAFGGVTGAVVKGASKISKTASVTSKVGLGLLDVSLGATFIVYTGKELMTATTEREKGAILGLATKDLFLFGIGARRGRKSEMFTELSKDLQVTERLRLMKPLKETPRQVRIMEGIDESGLLGREMKPLTEKQAYESLLGIKKIMEKPIRLPESEKYVKPTKLTDKEFMKQFKQNIGEELLRKKLGKKPTTYDILGRDLKVKLETITPKVRKVSLEKFKDISYGEPKPEALVSLEKIQKLIPFEKEYSLDYRNTLKRLKSGVDVIEFNKDIAKITKARQEPKPEVLKGFDTIKEKSKIFEFTKEITPIRPDVLKIFDKPPKQDITYIKRGSIVDEALARQEKIGKQAYKELLELKEDKILPETRSKQQELALKKFKEKQPKIEIDTTELETDLKFDIKQQRMRFERGVEELKYEKEEFKIVESEKFKQQQLIEMKPKEKKIKILKLKEDLEIYTPEKAKELSNIPKEFVKDATENLRKRRIQIKEDLEITEKIRAKPNIPESIVRDAKKGLEQRRIQIEADLKLIEPKKKPRVRFDEEIETELDVEKPKPFEQEFIAESEYYGKGTYERTGLFPLIVISKPSIYQGFKDTPFLVEKGLGANMFSDRNILKSDDLNIEIDKLAQPQALKQPQAFTPALKSDLALTQPQAQLQDQPQKFPEKLREEFEFPKKPKRKVFFDLDLEPSTLDEIAKKKEAYNVYVKKPKKKTFDKISKHPLNKIDSENLLSFTLDNSVARSGYLKPIRQKPKPLGLQIPNEYYTLTQDKFRPYRIKKGKKIAWKGIIEKSDFLIDTIGEKKQLSAFRAIAKLKKKKKEDNFQSYIMNL